MKNTILLSLLMFIFGSALMAQTDYDTVSLTYSVGDISTDNAFTTLGDVSTCPEELTLTLPNHNVVIVGVDVEYSMTAIVDAQMVDARSQLICTSIDGTAEAAVYSGTGYSQGTELYSRTGLNIANNVPPPPSPLVPYQVKFELHAGNYYWGAPIGCSDQQMVVDDGTWTISLIYLAAGSPGLPSNPGPADMTQLIDVDTDLTWDFGANTTSYDVFFDVVNPPLAKVVDDAATAGGSGSYDPGTMATGTTYYWYVVDRNSTNEIAGPVWSFSTDCGAWTVPYFDDFESYAWETLPSCWLSENTVGNPDCYVRVESNYNAYSGGNVMGWTNYGGEADPNITLVLPKVGTVSDYMISFYGLNGSNIFWGTPYTREFQIGTMTNPFDASTFTALTTWVPSATNWEFFEYLFIGYGGTDEYIAIRGDLNMDENQMYMDDFSLDLIPSCIKPLDVMATDVQANQVTLSWNDYSTPIGWNIEYGISGFTPGTGTVVPVATNPATITGLTDATDYDFYVQADCGGGDLSAWSTIYTVQTACLPYAVPLFEDFGPQLPYGEIYQYPVCWSNIEVNGSQWGGMGMADYESYSGACVWFSPEGDAASELIVITPEFADDINTLFVNFWTLAYGTEVILGTITDPTDFATFTGYDSVYTDGNVYQNHTVYFNNYVGTDTRIAFKVNAVDYPSQQLKLDEITIDAIPSCVEPYKPWIDGETQTSAMLNWTDPVELATAWQIEVGAPGFTPGTTTEIQAYAPTATEAEMHSFDMTGLTAATTYDTYIRTDCGASDYSVWVGPFTFLTQFGAIGTPPLAEDFESGMGITGNDPANNQNWEINTTVQHSGLNSVHNNYVYGTPANNILYVLGTIDLSSKADWMLTFWQIAKTNRNYTHCYVEISTDGGATYDQLPESTYKGAGYYREEGLYNNPEGPCFDELSYTDWGINYETPDNSWWKKEYFDLSSYNTFDNVVVRFRLVTDGYTVKSGWWIDDIAFESLGSPTFYADPLAITEDVYVPIPVSVDLTMGNSGGLPTTYTASVVYDEMDLAFEDFNAGIPVDWTIVDGATVDFTWSDTLGKYGTDNLDGTRLAWCDSYQGYGAGGTLWDDELISPLVDASAYIGGGLQLEFDQAFSAGWQAQDTAWVYVYDGTDWIEIYKSGSNDGSLTWSQDGGVHKVYNVSQYANANFQVKFRYTEESESNRGNYFAIDNFRLRASASALGWLTINGAEYTDGTAMPDADNLPSITDVNMNAAGIAPGVYTADIEVTSADPGFTTTLIPVQMTVYPAVAIDLIVYMEGPYDTVGGISNTMTTDLLTGAYLPLGQPYNPGLPYYGNNTPVWLYAGTESVTAVPAGTVDWILVQLRDAADAASAGSASAIATQPAFLLSDGSVVGLDGNRLNFLNVAVAQNLYVVIYHRNHLGTMSANAVTATGGIYSYDFSTTDTQVYGGASGHKDLGAGVWGMIAADGDADGNVLPSDETSVWGVDVNGSGYLGGDYDLNGLGQASDKTGYWVPNSNKSGQVPSAIGVTVEGYKSQIPE